MKRTSRITDKSRAAALKLTREKIRHLTVGDLNQAAGGCDTTSWTTEKAPPKTNGVGG